MRQHLTVHTHRDNWQEVYAAIDWILGHCKVTNVEFTDTPLTNRGPIPTGTVLVRTINIDMDTAMLICHRVPATFTVLLFNNLLPDPDEPIIVEQPEPGESGLEWEVRVDEDDQRRLDPDLPATDNS